jgi:hypothetical protein
MSSDCKDCGRKYIPEYNGADKMAWYGDFDTGESWCEICHDRFMLLKAWDKAWEESNLIQPERSKREDSCATA